MRYSPRYALGAICFLPLGCVGVNIDAASAGVRTQNVLDVDVCVIGGGAAGTYAAIKLRDMNKSVVLVEKEDRLGGHTKTYIDPASKQPIELGVAEYDNTSLVRNWFNRLQVPLYSFNFTIAGVTSNFVDFQTGKRANHTPTVAPEALERYVNQLANYPSPNYSLDNGSSPVPADLLLPFGEFISKYGYEGAMPYFGLYGQGWGNFVTLPTLYAIKYFTAEALEAQTRGALAAKANSKLYENAEIELGGDVLLSSTVLRMNRSAHDHADVTVQTPFGPTLIRAKKILSTIPPVLENLNGFDLNRTELSIFDKFRYHTWYVGLLNNSGIPDNLTLFNYGLSNETQYNLAALPAAYDFYATRVPGLHYFTFGLDDYESYFEESEIRTNIEFSLARLKARNILPSGPARELNILNLTAHTPYEVYVSSAEIGNGFYSKLFDLQGRRNTYWSGAAFVTHNSAAIWNYTDSLVEGIFR
ncbi:MAG: hypothetical protein HETSPECPRED_006572 [Heterodermia speciosa]|uniref:Amine oxidase domain-containing protein n=1 Tax=Heterodermia speciosa TaxID=116794 RepID=A0A8H3IUQ1_9LECA|nr:MAG: hypothetical protein HETSPECPRED_006572 [Heterodermia speciosa]